MLGLTANVNAPSDGSVQQLLRTLGVPLDWEPMVAAEGVLFVVTPETHMNLSMPLPPSGCSFYSEADGRRRAYRSLPALTEATLSAHLLRRQMAPALPIALATPRPTAGFVRFARCPFLPVLFRFLFLARLFSSSTFCLDASPSGNSNWSAPRWHWTKRGASPQAQRDG